MSRIKNWKREDNSGFIKVEGLVSWENTKTGAKVTVTESGGRFIEKQKDWVVVVKGESIGRFKTKDKAMKKARAFMRNHPKI